jgi:HAD superfamily hydrolase (TIGR01662 family)
LKVAALVPLKLNSRRLPNKNFLRLGSYPLAYHIFQTLVGVSEIEVVFCYASQPQIMSLLPQGVRFLPRPPRLDADEVKGNELFRYAVERIYADIIVLCHATAPFISAETIRSAIEKVTSGEYDSVASVRALKTYCWFKDRPLNYIPEQMVQTQDLDPVYAETSGIYVFKKEDYLRTNTRINGKTYLLEVDEREAVDIDYPNDFTLAAKLLDYDPSDSSVIKDNFFLNRLNAEARNKNIGLMCFDLDGVLIDSLPVMEQAWCSAMGEVGMEIPFASYAAYIGYPFYDILANLEVPQNLWEIIERTYNATASQARDAIIVYPGVIEGLKALTNAGIPIAIVTSKKRERTAAIVADRFAGISLSCVLTPEDVKPGRGKPHPDQLLSAALEVGVDPSNCVYVGDMDVDKQAAKRAGFQFVHAGWGYGSIASTDDVWFNSMDDLVEFFVSD